jgi:hypothetical protein
MTTTKTILMTAAFALTAGFAFAQGYGGGGGGYSYASSYVTNPNIFSNTPVIKVNGTVGQVLGASTTATTCSNYIVKYGRVGVAHTDVLKLKKFLNKYEAAGLSEDNAYTAATAKAVKTYQAKYSVNPISGHQLVKTTKVVNAQYCAYVAQGKGF